MPDSGLLVETWDGDETDIRQDLSHVLKKHGLDEGLASFLEETIEAHSEANGSASEFVTGMFVVYKNDQIRRKLRG